MVQRQSENIQLRGGTAGNVSQAAPTFTAPNVRAESTFKMDDGRTTILNSLLGTTGKLANQYIDRTLEEQYLAGAAKASQGEAEADVEGNPLTRAWGVAGYRDTAGRIKMAEAEATLQADMKRLRTESPEKFQQYLAQQRKTLTPSLEGMSAEARKGAFSKMLMNERAAIAQHSTQYQAYLIDLQNKAATMEWSTQVAKLTASKESGDTGTDLKQVQSAAVTLLDNVWANPRLTEDVRAKFTVQAMEHALANGHIALYQQIANTPMPKEFGGGTMLSRLPLEEQVKLSKQYRSEEDRTVWQRNESRILQAAVYDAQRASGEYNLTFQDAQNFASSNLRDRLWSREQYESFMKDHLVYGAKHQDGVKLTSAYLTGDVNAISAMGKDESSALEAMRKQLTKNNITPEQSLGMFVQAGKSGMLSAYKEIGNIANSSLANLQTSDGKVNPQHAGIIERVNAVLDSSADNPMLGIQVLSGISDDNKEMLSMIRARQKRGQSFDMAFNTTLSSMAKLSSLSPAEKAAISGRNAEEDRKFIGSIEAEGRFTAFTRYLMQPFSATAAALSTVSPDVFGERGAVHPEVINAYTQVARESVAEELNAQRKMFPTSPAEELHTSALANVAARTIKTKNGPVILPQGMDAYRMFGLSDKQAVPISYVGKAIDETFKSDIAGGRTVFSTRGDKLFYQEYDADGKPTSKFGTVDPKEVRPAFDKIAQLELKKYDEASGSGRQFIQGNIKFNYNGLNTIGADDKLMLQFRETLIKNEGVRDSVYEDSKGNKTIGVGIANKKYWPAAGPDGKVSGQAMWESLRAASDDAAKAGLAVQRSLGLNDKGFLLMSELAYQSGTEFTKLSKYQTFLQAMKTKDAGAAIKAFKETKAYELSGTDRRKHYERLIELTMRG